MPKDENPRPLRALYFDANILRALAFNLVDARLAKTIDKSSEYKVELWVPETVVREVVGHHVRKIRAYESRIRSFHKSLDYYAKACGSDLLTLVSVG